MKKIVLKKLFALYHYFGLRHDIKLDEMLKTDCIGAFYMYQSATHKHRYLSGAANHFEGIAFHLDELKNYVRKNTEARLSVSALVCLLSSPIALINAWFFAGWCFSLLAASVFDSAKQELRLMKFKQLAVLYEFDDILKGDETRPGLFTDHPSIQCVGLVEGRRLSHWLAPAGVYRALYWGTVQDSFGLVECLKQPGREITYQAMTFPKLLDDLRDGGHALLGFESRQQLFDMMSIEYLEHIDQEGLRHPDMLASLIDKSERALENVSGDLIRPEHLDQWCRRYLPKHLGKNSESVVTLGYRRATFQALRNAGLEIYLPRALLEDLLKIAIEKGSHAEMDTLFQKMYWNAYQDAPEFPLPHGFVSLLAVYHDSEHFMLKEADLRMINMLARELGPDVLSSGAHSTSSKMGFREVFGLAEACSRFPVDKRLFITQDLDL